MIMRRLARGALGSLRWWLFCRIMMRRMGRDEDRWARDRKHPEEVEGDV